MAQTWTAGRLTATQTGELDLARAHLRALVESARELTAAAGHEPGRGPCDRAGCALADVPNGERLCGLAHRLAQIDLDAPATPPRPDAATTPAQLAPCGAGDADVDLAAALVAFRGALVASLDAVRACRSVGHPEGRCWFGDGAGDDGCGEVLRAAHLTG